MRTPTLPLMYASVCMSSRVRIMGVGRGMSVACRLSSSSVPEPPLPEPGDALLDRKDSRWGSRKWLRFGPDVIPLWVADMDFRAPPAVIEAVTAVAAHGVYGYTDPSPALKQAAVDRLATRYGLQGCEEAWIRWLPGLIPGLNHVVRARAAMDGRAGAVVSTTPIYAPFLMAPENCGAELIKVPLAETLEGDVLRFELDLPALEEALRKPEAGVLLWCNPHNPTGRVWSKDELRAVAELCVRHDVTLLSDEVWGEMVLEPEKTPFVGMGSLMDEVPGLESRLIVLTSPSKAFNVAASDIAIAAIPDPQLRRAFTRAGRDKAEVTPFGFAACEAAYTDPDVELWRQRLVTYLRANRDHIEKTLIGTPGLPGPCSGYLRCTRPEASYLTWIDAKELQVRSIFLPALMYRPYLPLVRAPSSLSSVVCRLD